MWLCKMPKVITVLSFPAYFAVLTSTSSQQVFCASKERHLQTCLTTVAMFYLDSKFAGFHGLYVNLLVRKLRCTVTLWHRGGLPCSVSGRSTSSSNFAKFFTPTVWKISEKQKTGSKRSSSHWIQRSRQRHGSVMWLQPSTLHASHESISDKTTRGGVHVSRFCHLDW